MSSHTPIGCIPRNMRRCAVVIANTQSESSTAKLSVHGWLSTVAYDVESAIGTTHCIECQRVLPVMSLATHGRRHHQNSLHFVPDRVSYCSYSA